MQLIIEALALAAFHVQRAMSADKVLVNIIDFVIRDEARHVAFGVNYMAEFIKELSAQEVQERAEFDYEACRVMRDRIVPTDVFEYYGFDVDEGRERFLVSGQMDQFRNLLFTRIVPNVKHIGLWGPRIRKAYTEMGIIELARVDAEAMQKEDEAVAERFDRELGIDSGSLRG